jgi:hypothetical protein
MAHWQLGEKDKAREWFAKAVQWMEKGNPENAERKRFRAEAAELLGVAKQDGSTGGTMLWKETPFMTIVEQLIEKVQALSDDQKKLLEILVAWPSVQGKTPASEEGGGSPPPPRQTLLGRFAHRGVHLTAEDIAEVRREMWHNFPRDLPDPKPDAS